MPRGTLTSTIYRTATLALLAGTLVPLGACGMLDRFALTGGSATSGNPGGMYTGRDATAAQSTTSAASTTPTTDAQLGTDGAPTASTQYAARQATGTNPTDIYERTTGVPMPRAERPSSQVPATDLVTNPYGVNLSPEITPAGTTASGERNTENVRRVTFTQTGADFDPFVSRDGKYVLFASTQHRETADIYMKDLFGRTITRLTSSPAHDAMPALSPDNTHLAFASNRSGTWNIYLMPARGGQPVRITDDDTQDLHPTWSPDGSQIAFCRLGQQSGRWELWVTDVAQPGALRFIGYGLFPEWCPVAGTGALGADQILFQRSRERDERTFSVWTLDYDPSTGNAGRETEIVSSATNALINPSWSPDGDFVAYASVPADADLTPDEAKAGSSLWVIGADGRGHVQIVGGDSLDLMPAWSTQNDLIFVSDRAGVESLWTIELEGPLTTAMAQRGENGMFRGGSEGRQPVVGVPTDAEPIPGQE